MAEDLAVAKGMSQADIFDEYTLRKAMSHAIQNNVAAIFTLFSFAQDEKAKNARKRLQDIFKHWRERVSLSKEVHGIAPDEEDLPPPRS